MEGGEGMVFHKHFLVHTHFTKNMSRMSEYVSIFKINFETS